MRSRRSAGTPAGWAAIVAAVGLVLAAAVPANAYPRPGRTERVSVGLGGAGATGPSDRPAITPDGRYVAFESAAGNLVHGDTNGAPDIFVRDRLAGVTHLVSVATDGTRANRESGDPSLSADGRHVAFWSEATNLVPGDTNDAADIFVRNLETGTTERVSVASDGAQADAYSFVPSISADGRFVAFTGPSSNLVPGDTNGRWDVFVHDRQTGETERASVTTDGAEVPGLSNAPAISADGRHVAFQAESALVADDTNGEWDVYVRDRQTGETERVSVADDHPVLHGVRGCPGITPALPGVCAGQQGFGPSLAPSISADGRFVAFQSTSDNLVPADTNGTSRMDVFVRDRETGVTERVSVASHGGEVSGASVRASIGADGRFVAFESDATTLVPGDTEGARDVFVHDRVTGATDRVSVGPDGTGGDGDSVLAAFGGRHVAFAGDASNLVAGDADGRADVFVRDLGPPVGVGGVSAVPDGGAVSVSGWATFPGNPTSVADPPGDGLPPAESAGAEITGLDLIPRPEREDLLVRLRLTSLPRLQQGGWSGVRYTVAFDLDGVAHEVRATRQADGASPPESEPTFTLLRCDPDCVEAGPVTGGIGTAGPEVRISVPLASLGAAPETAMTDIRAFTTMDDDEVAGAPATLDEVVAPDVALEPPTVSLGVAPAGLPEEAVAFDVEASLSRGAFSGSVPDPGPGSRWAWARACLGDLCHAASIPLDAT